MRFFTSLLLTGGAALAVVLVIGQPAFAATTSVRASGYRFERANGFIQPASLSFDNNGALHAFENDPDAPVTAFSQTLSTRNPDGSFDTLDLSTRLRSSAGMAYDPVDDRLLVTDNLVTDRSGADVGGKLYSYSLETGRARELVAGLDTIDDVAVRPGTGEIFVSDAAGGGAGGVYQVNRQTGGLSAVADGLDFASGLAFDPNGNLIYQQSTGTFSGEIYRLPIDDSGAALSFDSDELLLSGSDIPTSDLTVDSEGDIFATGTDVVAFDASDGFSATTLFSNDNPGQFAGEIDFLDGDGPFEPGAAPNGNQLAFTPDFGAESVMLVTVPAPATASLLVLGAGMLLCRRR